MKSDSIRVTINFIFSSSYFQVVVIKSLPVTGRGVNVVGSLMNNLYYLEHSKENKEHVIFLNCVF